MILDIQRQFDRAAQTYDRYATFQAEVGEALRRRLRDVPKSTRRILDLGCGTGTQAYWLRTEYPYAQVICADLSSRMLEESRTKFGDDFSYWCGSADYLALQSASIDIVFANLSLQWVSDLSRAAAEIHRILSPGGVLVFSLLTDRTLFEISESIAQLFPEEVSKGKFPSVDSVSYAFEKHQWKSRELHTEVRTVHYDNLRALLRTIKGIGGNYPVVVGRRAFSPRKFLNDLEKVYDSRYRRNGFVGATYEIVWGVLIN